MKNLILVLLLVSFTIQQGNNQPTYQLSPPLPPTAFVGQYYTCQFRVLGLDYPSFEFQGLPSCFTGSKAGIIEGVPLSVGSYPFTVIYTAQGVARKKQIVIRIASALNSATEVDLISNLQVPFTINCESDQYVYMAGNKVTLRLSALAGTPPYKWTYLRLPTQLDGDSDGVIIGYFEQQGYYSFGVTCSDSEGNSTDAFYTLNVQPLTFYSRYNDEKPIVNVPNRNTPLQYSIDQISPLLTAAFNVVYGAAKVVSERRSQIVGAQQMMTKTNSSLDLARKQIKAVEVLYNRSMIANANALNAYNDAKVKLSKAKDRVNITSSAIDQANNILKEGEQNLKDANTTFIQANLTLSQDNALFIEAQNNSTMSASLVHQMMMNVTNYQISVNMSFSSVSLAKQLLQNASNQEQMAESDVNKAQNAKQMAQMSNDQATKGINSADAVVTNATLTLKQASQEVAKLRDSLKSAATYLGGAKFNLTQAMNNLYVAQAAKEQADKALLLASATETATKSGNITYIFGGCDPSLYPSMFGTSRIKSIKSPAYQLDSGYMMVKGDCNNNKAVAPAEGDSIFYEGYLKDGYVHVYNLSKL